MSQVENQPNLQPTIPLPERPSDTSSQSPERSGNALEQAPISAERATAASQMPAPIPATIPLPVLPTLSQSDVSTTTNSATPAVADDGDLIEKEWVDRAKKIVETNRSDPYKQSEELTVVKADYMQKRYNKAVKLNK